MASSVRKRVLVVDDTVAIRNVLRQSLQQLPIDVEEAASGHEAFRKATQQPYDLIVLDLMMPDWDGMTTLGAVHIAFPDTRVVIQSGYLNDPAENTIREMDNVAGVFRKPYNPEDLVRKVADILEVKTSEAGQGTANPATEPA